MRQPELSYDELREKLVLDKHALDDAIEDQPELFHIVALQVARAISVKDGLKRTLDITKADVADRLRSEKIAASQKVVETKIAQDVLIDQLYKDAADVLSDARVEVERWSALKESYNQRSYMIRELGSLYIAGYWELDSVRSGDRGDIRQRIHEKREATREKRASSSPQKRAQRSKD